MKLELDKTGDVEKIFNMVIEEYEDEFSFLVENAIFQFSKRSTPKYDEDGQEIAATASKLSNRERDLYGSDFEICVYEPYWETLSTEQKKRLIYHELLHCAVAPDEDDENNPAYDNDDRVVVYCVPHDLICKTFKAEIEEFGLQSSDLELAEFFHNQYELYLQQQEERKKTNKTNKANKPKFKLKR